MLLIGSGGSGDGAGTGGGSGAVTVWYGAAQHVPDNLVVQPSPGSNNTHTNIYYRSATAGLVLLVRANSSSGSPTAGSATAANAFTASGFFQSTAGQNGTTGSVAASTTTFLSGGAGTTQTVTANYGYTTTRGGYLNMQPILVGVGGSNANGVGGIGCGGSGSGVGRGGQGMVLIASW